MSVEIAPGARPEFRLLALCSRSRLSPEHAEGMRALLGGGLDWSYLVALAAYHGVQPLLYCHLKAVGGAVVPPEPLDRLRAIVGARTARSMLLTQELGRVTALLAAHGVPTLSVKGASLALEVYGSLALRPFMDIDLLVRRSDFARLEAVLLEEGFLQIKRTPFKQAGHLFVHGQSSFSRRLSEGPAAAFAIVDVHTAVVPRGYSYTERFDALWARSRAMAVGEAEVRTLSPEDLLLVLCYHGFKTRWDRLKYICDVAELLRVAPGMDWRAIEARARAMRSRRVLFLGLFLAQEAFGAAVPERLRAAALAEPHVRELGAAALERLPMEAHMRVEPYRDRVRLNLLGQDSFAGRARYSSFSALRWLYRLALETKPKA